MAGDQLRACGCFSSRVSGKNKKLQSLHYTAARLLEKGVLLEIEDLPLSQYVAPGPRVELLKHKAWVGSGVVSRSNAFELRKGGFRLPTRKKSFMGAVKHWSGLPMVVESPATETIKVKLDVALSNLIELQMSPVTADRLDDL